jgi:hypothetical protein
MLQLSTRLSNCYTMFPVCTTSFNNSAVSLTTDRSVVSTKASSTECDLILFLSIYSILSFPSGRPVAAYVFFLFFGHFRPMRKTSLLNPYFLLNSVTLTCFCSIDFASPWVFLQQICSRSQQIRMDQLCVTSKRLRLHSDSCRQVTVIRKTTL